MRKHLSLQPAGGGRLLEVGCGEGRRLGWMQEHLGLDCYGLEPSIMAVDMAQRSGVHAVQGTADQLPYADSSFDIAVFGFCLYLCDRADLFRIAFEADRVLKEHGWLIIHDFYASTPMRREYHHKAGIYSYKMDYRRLFDWHPGYTCFSHEMMHHGRSVMTDDAQEWVATSVLRKSMNNV